MLVLALPDVFFDHHRGPLEMRVTDASERERDQSGPGWAETCPHSRRAMRFRERYYGFDPFFEVTARDVPGHKGSVPRG